MKTFARDAEHAVSSVASLHLIIKNLPQALRLRDLYFVLDVHSKNVEQPSHTKIFLDVKDGTAVAYSVAETLAEALPKLHTLSTEVDVLSHKRC